MLPHIIAGDPGNLALAYWTGQKDGADIHWHTMIARVTQGLSAHPDIDEQRVSSISSDTGTASQLMGACDQNPQTAGIEGGLSCGRSADVFGIAQTPSCYVTTVWPVRNNTDAADRLTLLSTQTGGEPLHRRPARRR